MGNTLTENAVFPFRQNHPHRHEEYAAPKATRFTVPDTPPHTWGIPAVWIVFGVKHGRTPTHVGNRLSKAP